MPDTLSQPSSEERTPWLAALAVASCGVVWAVTEVPYLPTHDGPEHILSGYIENHYNDPGAVYARHLAPAPQYAARGFALLFRPLEGLLGWRSATQVVIALTVLVFAWAFAWLVTSLDARRRWAALLGFAVGFPWVLYMGFFPYLVGSAFGALVLAFVVSRRDDRPLTRLLVAAALGFQAHLHVFTSIATGAIVALIFLLRRPKEERPREIALCIAMTSPVLVMAGVVALDNANATSRRPPGDAVFWGTLMDRLSLLPRFVVPGAWWRGAIILALAGLGVLSALDRARRAVAHRDERALAIGAALFLGAGLIAPLNIPGWQFFNPRLLAFGAVLALPLLALERIQPVSWAKVAAAATFALGLLGPPLRRSAAPPPLERLRGLSFGPRSADQAFLCRARSGAGRHMWCGFQSDRERRPLSPRERAYGARLRGAARRDVPCHVPWHPFNSCVRGA